MIRSLYTKFALMAFVLFALLGVLLVYLHTFSAHMYQQESQQNLHKNLAQHIVKFYGIVEKGRLNKKRLDHLFHNLMEVNPAIEIYALNIEGKILAYNAPPDKVVREHIDLQPVREFLVAKKPLPISGQDPRSLKADKIFSAAKLKNNGRTVGYLYVILEGERYSDVFSHLMNSYIFQVSSWVIVIAVVVALLFALLGFAMMTKRLRRLAGSMNAFREGGFASLPEEPVASTVKGDELDQLTHSFNLMSERMVEQLNKLKQADNQRRELVANVSHDLRTPLTTLQGYLETLIRKKSELSDAEKEKYIRTAVKHSKSLARLVSELFELAQLDANEQIVKMEPFSLPELVHDVMQKYWLPASQRNINVVTHFDKQIPFVKGDIALIERVLNNLIENAIRYTPNNGEISVDLDLSDDRVLVQVKDTGCGIAEKELPMIFGRFYRPEKSRTGSSGGAGLGLAIAKKILELHGSNIRADSKINQGTVFKFDLPVSIS